VNNPYGLVTGPDRALYFCDLDNQRIRRLDLKTRRTTAVAGNGQRAYGGDGGAATAAALNMPHEIQFDSAGNMYIAERDNHVVRKVEAKTGIISTFAGTGMPGFSGDGGPAARAQLRQPHSIAVNPSGKLLICDIGNHRIRQVDFSTGMIDTYGGTGERLPTPDGAPVKTAPLNGPRTMSFDRDGNLYLALREGNAIYRIASALRLPRSEWRIPVPADGVRPAGTSRRASRYCCRLFVPARTPCYQLPGRLGGCPCARLRAVANHFHARGRPILRKAPKYEPA
jgi:sugar lactone lactonase YvrE